MQSFGRLCKLKATKKITLDEFFRLKKIINDAYLEDLKLILWFNNYDEKYHLYEGDFYSIINLGLLYQESPYHEDIEIIDKDENYYNKFEIKGMEFFFHLTDTGKKLYEYFDFLFDEIL